MTRTIILDETERDRRFVNHLNEILRHCRIGKVRTKIVSGHGYVLAPMPKRWFPDPERPAPTPMFMDKCGCRVGSACGNAACPHRMVVTCGDIYSPPLVPSHGVLM